MNKKRLFLARLDQTFAWVQYAISDNVIGSKKDRIAMREVAGMVFHLGRLQRRLKFGTVRRRKAT